MTPDAPEAPRTEAGRARWRFVRAPVWLALACGLAPFVWALGFCFPRGDDFDEVTRAMFLFDLPGGLYEVGREWLTWSGRYTYHFLAVFLGKAGELRLVSGLVCGAVLALHGAAFYGFARVAGVARRDALPLALLGVLALCACTGFLPGFYLLTDALTTGLQSAAALLFFWSLCALWERCGAAPADGPAQRRSRRGASLLGVLAVGVFEHAALAVISGACIACALAWFHDRRQGLCLAAGRLRVFLRVGLWCAGALLLSFLAPGNFARRAARGIDAEIVGRQLAALLADWLHALGAFAGSLWPVAALGLALLPVLLRQGRPARLTRGEALLLAALCPAVFCLFSLALGALHALSDAPLPSSPKLAASMGLYAACALGFSASALLHAVQALARPRPRAALLAGAVLFGLCLASGNFQATLRSAVNGHMALYAETMERRDAWLRHEGALSVWHDKFRFGLAGEVLYPGSRSRALKPGAAVTLVCQWRRPVLPVWSFGGLPQKPAAWPNQWVAWMYGVEAVASARPSPAPAVAAVFGRAGGPGAIPGPDGPLSLSLPTVARRLGLTGAWRVNAQGGPNPTFALDWLVLESEKALPKALAVLAPSPLSRARMAPLFVQAWLLREAGAGGGALAAWAGPELVFNPALWRVKGAPVFRYAFPLGPACPLAHGAPGPGEWPARLFLKLSGAGLLELAPAPVLDSALESG